MKTKKWGMCGCQEVPTIDPETGKCQNGCGARKQHTPTPWRTDDSLTIFGKVGGAPWGIAKVILAHELEAPMQSANAALIVRAVNSHEQYEQTMRRVSSELRNLACRYGSGEIQNQLHFLADDLFNATIPKAGGK